MNRPTVAAIDQTKLRRPGAENLAGIRLHSRHDTTSTVFSLDDCGLPCDVAAADSSYRPEEDSCTARADVVRVEPERHSAFTGGETVGRGVGTSLLQSALRSAIVRALGI